MRKIIINGRFLTHRITGVERYAREILSELDKLVNEGEIELVVPPETTDIPNYMNIGVSIVGRFHNRMWEHISFPLYVAKKQGISLNLCNVAPLPSPGIVCIHDVRIKAAPEYFSKKFLLWYNLLFRNETKRAKGIITVSEFSKSEIMKYYHVDADRIAVIPNAWQHYKRIGYDEGALKKYGVEKGRYFFSMCSLEPNKNFRWVAEVAKKNPEQVFAVAGSVNEKVFAEGLGFQCPENMRLLGYVSDEEAKTLMRDCRAFLFPTFYEGFGIPPLEAISAGTRCVVVADTAVMHEIFGDSVVYVDPYDHGASFKDIQGRETDEEERQRVLEKYSWEKSARALKECIRDIHSEMKQ